MLEKMVKKLIFILFCSLFSNFSYAERIGETRYVIGGLAGTFVGLGSGHAIQGRWLGDDGYALTLAELATLGVIATAKPTYTCTGVAPALKCTDSYPDYITAAAILFLAVRVYEIIDVWSPSTHMSVGIIPQMNSPKLYLALNF